MIKKLWGHHFIGTYRTSVDSGKKSFQLAKYIVFKIKLFLVMLCLCQLECQFSKIFRGKPIHLGT